MYKTNMLLSTIFLKTPHYHGRNFFKSRMEGLEHSILLSLVDNISRVVSLFHSIYEREKICLAWGKMWILVDDIQDEMNNMVPNAVLCNILTGEQYPPHSSNILLNELTESARYVNEITSPTPFKHQYLLNTKNCFDNQISVTKLRKHEDKIKHTLSRKKRRRFCSFSNIRVKSNKYYP